MPDFHEKAFVKRSTWRPGGFPACLAFIRTLSMGCRCPVHVSVRVRCCYLDLGSYFLSIGNAYDPVRHSQSPDTTWGNGQVFNISLVTLLSDSSMVERIINRFVFPYMMHHNGQLPGHGYHSLSFGDLSAPRGDA